MKAKDFADFARHTAQPNMISWGGNLNLWLPIPATRKEWEARSIQFHDEQARRASSDREASMHQRGNIAAVNC